MPDFPSLYNSSNKQIIEILEQEIAALDHQLQQVEISLNTFEQQIRLQLREQIMLIRELTALYKQQKQAKKEKRLAQKKKGKNYKEPAGLKKTVRGTAVLSQLPEEKLQQLKRLYKEAIVQIHPDKFSLQGEEITLKATELTAQLNQLYKNEDLDELSLFHEHIISGNAMAHTTMEPVNVVNPQAMKAFLENKKHRLQAKLQEAMQSQTYVVLTTYEQPEHFIEELRVQFNLRIEQLKKRTRKG